MPARAADVALTYLPARRGTDTPPRPDSALSIHGRRALLLEGDLTEHEFCRAIVEETVAQLGRLDNRRQQCRLSTEQERFEDRSDEQWDRTFRTNAYACFRVTKAALSSSHAAVVHHPHELHYRPAR